MYNGKTVQTLICYFAYVIAFEDLIYVYGQESQEMVEQGRTQYQLLQERGSLPQYGSCWKDAIRHVEDGCRALSEDSQAEIALHLTNCFLMMSGHDTYECEINKKPNLRAICINTMSDRAFNVYTEFYTHTQNICWFLRGQIWHETIAESSWKVGKQLQDSAKNQEQILKNQKESIELQERLLEYGNALEKSMEQFYKSSRDQQEILSLFASSLSNLQSWLIGEISWIDTLVFYVITSLFVVFFTSVPRTNNVRLLMLTILTLNMFVERLICRYVTANVIDNIKDIQNLYQLYIWGCRYICLFINVTILILSALFYKDANILNNRLLTDLHDKVILILSKIDALKPKSNYYLENNVSYTSECSPKNGIVEYLDSIKSNISKEINEGRNDNSVNDLRNSSSSSSSKFQNNNFSSARETLVRSICGRKKINFSRDVHDVNQYNLRSRNNTPDCNI